MKNIKKVKQYIADSAFLLEHFKNNMPTIHKIDDGKLNNVYMLTLDDENITPLLLKHFPEFITEEKRKIFMPKKRELFEYKGLQSFKEATPRYVPTPYLLDEQNQLIIMEFIQNAKSFKELINTKADLKQTLSSLAEFIAANINATALDTKKISQEFLESEMQHYIFESLFIVAPHILAQSENLKKNVAFLQKRFFSQETFTHGNLQQSSILVKNNSIFVLDYETFFIGPLGFDTGRFLSSVLIDYLFYSRVDAVYANHILATTSEFLEKVLRKTTSKKEEFISDIFGFGALYIIQHASYLKIQNNTPKAFSDTLLNLAFAILEHLKELKNMQDLTQIMRKVL
ncbi:MAG: hypothetical protein FP820_09840 [Sulfurimonas sp.]|nr:hypothetical protein [Sulfurimonas sp.]MBU3939577.1 hypothetical protein [bacterium]